jgi:hypothetical protein
VSRGELNIVSDTVHKLTGRPAVSLSEFLGQRR